MTRRKTIRSIDKLDDKIGFNILEADESYEYSLKDLYWYNVKQLIREVEQKAHIPESVIDEIIEIYDLMGYGLSTYDYKCFGYLLT